MQISTSVGVVQYIRVSLRSIMTTNLCEVRSDRKTAGVRLSSLPRPSWLSFCRSGRGQAGDPLIPIVFATAGRGGLTDRANDLVLDEVGTALNLVARAPWHDRHCGGRVLR
jgi:hypothetical protein